MQEAYLPTAVACSEQKENGRCHDLESLKGSKWAACCYWPSGSPQRGASVLLKHIAEADAVDHRWRVAAEQRTAATHHEKLVAGQETTDFDTTACQL